MTKNLVHLQALACQMAGHAVQLEHFGVLAAFDAAAALKFSNADERRCRMTFLLAGEPGMNDWRDFCMTPDDTKMVRNNFVAEGSLLPLLYDHGWSGRGTMSAGRIIELPDDTPNLDALCRLTPSGWREVVEEEAWLSRSAGFYGYTDKEDRIHPVALAEGSFTSLPAMKGLGAVQPMTALFSRFQEFTRAAPQAAAPGRSSVLVGLHAGVAAPEAAPAPTTPSASPAEAISPTQEVSMKLSKEALARLGLEENATDAQADAAILKFASPAPPAAAAPAADVRALVAEALREQNAAHEATARAGKITALIAAAVERGALPSGDGEDARAQRDEYARAGEKLGTAFLERTLEGLTPKFAVGGRPGARSTFTRSAADAPRMSRFQELTGKPSRRELVAEAQAALSVQADEMSAVLQFQRVNRVPFRVAKAQVLGA